jgi:hypothetical protein
MGVTIFSFYLFNVGLFTTPVVAETAGFCEFNLELVEEYKRSIAWEEMGGGRSVATPWSYYFVRGGAIVVAGFCASQLVAPGALTIGMVKSFVAVKAMVSPGVVLPALVGLVVPGCVVPDVVPVVEPVLQLTSNLTSQLLEVIFQMRGWERSLHIFDISDWDPWCKYMGPALFQLYQLYSAGLYFPSLYLIEEISEGLQAVFKHAKTIDSLFKVKPIDRNILWEPAMAEESWQISRYVRDV